MREIPHQVLSEAFAEHIRGRRLEAAVFLTFQFEPDFFEQEVLPVFIDMPLSHVPEIRLVNLEEALARDAGPIEVYYDRRALVPGDGSAHLSTRRIPVSWRTGVFHPKNVFAILEDREPDKQGLRARHLLVATMSANLTRAGWWSNVEVCHIEMVPEGAKCGFREDLLELFGQIRRAASDMEESEALERIRRFVLRLEPRQSRTGNGVLHPRLYVGKGSVPDFLEEVHEGRLRGLNLEIISPFFDKGSGQRPLADLIERFQPKQLRVFLPRAHDGAAECDREAYASLLEYSSATWASLPEKILQSGTAKDALPRTVHAKVYRFFDPAGRYEAIFLGSVNLTSAAHRAGGNLETGILIETDPQQRPDWWLQAEEKEPRRFVPRGETDGADEGIGTHLSIRYDWSEGRAEAYWDKDTGSPSLSISAQGSHLFDLPGLGARCWTAVPDEGAKRLADVLRSTSFLTVSVDGSADATILVIEERMAGKPSILFTLTVAEILKYWTLLKPEQREAVITQVLAANGALPPELAVRLVKLGTTTDSFFDSFAGIFHAFACLERAVFAAVKAEQYAEVEYRMFGKKYDSLPTLLERVTEQEDADRVDAYVIFLCARQLLVRFQSELPDLDQKYATQVRALEAQVLEIEAIRERFRFGSPEERARFFEWFDRRFLAHAQPEEAVKP